MRDLAWVAGFLEGEGSFCQRNARVSAVQKDPECLYRLQRWFSGTVVRKGGTGFSVDAIHEWSCYGPTAMGLMLTIYSFMSQRRKEQIRTGLKTFQDRRAAALANRKTWSWYRDESGKRRYVDVTDRVGSRRAS